MSFLRVQTSVMRRSPVDGGAEGLALRAELSRSGPTRLSRRRFSLFDSPVRVLGRTSGLLRRAGRAAGAPDPVSTNVDEPDARVETCCLDRLDYGITVHGLLSFGTVGQSAYILDSSLLMNGKTECSRRTRFFRGSLRQFSNVLNANFTMLFVDHCVRACLGRKSTLCRQWPDIYRWLLLVIRSNVAPLTVSTM